MPCASRAMLLCGAFFALSVVPSQQVKAGRQISTGHSSPFAAEHDPGSSSPQQHRRHQCHRNARQQQQCRRQQQDIHPSAAFAVLARGRRPNSSRERGRTEVTPRFLLPGGATSTYVSRPRAGRRRRERDSSGLPRCHSTAGLEASASPGDVSFTSQVLSPAEILEYVRRVDFFDLPPGGVTAGEAGYPKALPLQVLECIRHRHGLPEFAGGRLLLDPEYDYDETTAAGSGTAEDNNNNNNSEGRGLLFPGLRLLHAEPIVIGVDDFFTPEECDEYISRSVSPPQREYVSRAGMGPFEQPAALNYGQHTSTTFIHQFSEVPELMAKASALIGVEFAGGQWEEAQTVRYRPGEEFSWHLDAMTPTPDMESQGGQRIANLVVYLNDLPDDDGGATVFKNLGLRVRPRKGSALVFFPSFGGVPDCPLDPLLLHAGEMLRPGAGQDKWIAQLRLRQGRTTPIHKDNQHAHAEAAVDEFDEFWRSSFLL